MSEAFEQLRDAYLAWPSRARSAFEAGLEVARKTPPAYASVERLVVCGMGGSGIVGDYLAILSRTYGGVPVEVVKGFEPPRSVDRRTLVLAVSFSGATSETIRCAVAAHNRGALVAAVSGSGPLSEEAKSRGWPLVQVPPGPAARAMFATLFYSSLGFLEGLGLVKIPAVDIEESFKVMAETSIEDSASSVASRIAGQSIVVIASTSELEPLPLRACQEICENAKIACLPLYTPEALHNYIEGVTSLSGSAAAVAYLWGGYQSIRLLEPLLEVLLSREAGIHLERVEVRAKSPIAALMYSTLHAGLTSIHAARLRGVDPLSTPRIKRARRVAEEVL